MDALGTVANASGTIATPSPRARGFGDLAGDDFFQLLITQITNQDPLEPTGNQELLDQISSIREIELSTAMSSTMQALSVQQQYAAASALIGRYVTGPVSEDGAQISGPVVGARFDQNGGAILQLSTGDELPLEQVTGVQTAERIGETLVGKSVRGVDLREPSDPQEVQGVVTAVRTDEAGDLLLELDTGADLRLADVTTIGNAGAEEEQQPPGDGLVGKASQAIKRLLGGLIG